jgi:hypothetical protein
MTQRRCRLTLFVSSLVMLLSCTMTAQKPAPEDQKQHHKPVKAFTTPVTVTISIDGSNTCTQSPHSFADVQIGSPVHWVTDKAVQGFEVAFQSPFDDFNSPSSYMIDSGPSTGVQNVTYPYTMVRIGNRYCNNAYQLGLIMRP